MYADGVILNVELRDEIAEILARDAAVLQIGRAPYIRMLLAAIALGRKLPVPRRRPRDCDRQQQRMNT